MTWQAWFYLFAFVVAMIGWHLAQRQAVRFKRHAEEALKLAQRVIDQQRELLDHCIVVEDDAPQQRIH